MSDLGKRYILHEKGKKKQYWDGFIGIQIVYSVFMIPVQIGFSSEPSDDMFIFNLIMDGFFMLDILVGSRTAYFCEKDDVIQTIPKKIRAHYLKNWFFIDFFSSIPFDAILTQFLNATHFSSIRLIKVVR